VATNVVAPFRLSCLLSPLLGHAERAVIVTVSSGGMYTQRFDVDTLEMSPDGYRGTTAYARAKRAQVELAREWSCRWGGDGVASYSMHPGWVDTPGLRESLPGLARLGPLLRNSEQGADTVVWLAADGPRSEGGKDGSDAMLDGFWLDRRRRGEYYLPSTRLSPEEDLRRREQLWRWCAARAGIGSLPDESVL
jgi:NAD(P)-dependent dehydrogenase (short-subunit alcohol dehydrogenase family)